MRDLDKYFEGLHERIYALGPYATWQASRMGCWTGIEEWIERREKEQEAK